MNYFRVQALFMWFPFLVTCLPPPYFISKPSKMELFLKCLHTHPHSLNCTPCLGAGCVRSGRPITPCSERPGGGQQDGAGLEGTLEAAHSSPTELGQSQRTWTAWQDSRLGFLKGGVSIPPAQLSTNPTRVTAKKMGGGDFHT